MSERGGSVRERGVVYGGVAGATGREVAKKYGPDSREVDSREAVVLHPSNTFTNPQHAPDDGASRRHLYMPLPPSEPLNPHRRLAARSPAHPSPHVRFRPPRPTCPANTYVSERRFTKSISKPQTFTVAVSRCFDWSGLAMMRPILLFGIPRESRWSFTASANWIPETLSSAMSTSWDGFPRSLSRTHPPATRSTVPWPVASAAESSVSKSVFSALVSVMLRAMARGAKRESVTEKQHEL